MIYWGIFENGTLISNSEFKEIANVPHVEYFLQSKGNHHKFLYRDGTTNFLQVGGFQLQDISPSYIGPNKLSLKLTICEVRLNSTFQINIEDHGIGFVKERLLPIMHELNDFGSYKAYKQFLELEELKQTNATLLEKIRILEQS